MSFTTRCPACGTMFKVVPDQLKISDGWVRCGHCSDVFDAMLNLQTEAPPPSVAPPASFPPAPVGSPAAAVGSSRVVIRRTPIAAPPAPPPIAQIAPPPMAAPPPTAALASTAQVPAAASMGVAVLPLNPAPDLAGAFATPAGRDVNKPSLDPSVGVLWPSAVDGDFSNEVESSAGDDWDSEWLLSPNNISRHREAVAQELQLQGVLANQPQRAVQPVGEAFARELGAIAGASTVPVAEPLPDVVRSESVENVVRSRLENEDEVEVEVGDDDDDSIWPLALPDPEAEDSKRGAEPDEPTFVVQGRREAFWRSPAMRAVLLLLAVGLSALLSMQWASFERDQLAARYPALEPILKQLCAATGCSLAAPRRIEAVAIDSSTLTRKLGQFYSFDLVLKNSEPMAIAMPALELSLTDASDKQIARRVFLPKEMPGTPTTVPANGRLSVSMRLSLSESDLGSMAGYRALVFYP